MNYSLSKCYPKTIILKTFTFVEGQEIILFINGIILNSYLRGLSIRDKLLKKKHGYEQEYNLFRHIFFYSSRFHTFDICQEHLSKGLFLKMK